MRLFNFVILFFLLSAFTVGIALEQGGSDKFVIDSAIDNATIVFDNITLTPPSDINIPNIEGFFSVIEKYIGFVGSLGMETMRAGINFGYDNPDYFSPEFIIQIMKLMILVIVISLLIKPLGYAIVFIVMLSIFLKEKLNKEKKENGRV